MDRQILDDVALDAWIAARVGTAVHLSGTAPMGPDGDRGAVVDQHLRVRGVAGLRVVDTSVLPSVPSRGTAATAEMLPRLGRASYLGARALGAPDAGAAAAAVWLRALAGRR